MLQADTRMNSDKGTREREANLVVEEAEIQGEAKFRVFVSRKSETRENESESKASIKDALSIVSGPITHYCVAQGHVMREAVLQDKRSKHTVIAEQFMIMIGCNCIMTPIKPNSL